MRRTATWFSAAAVLAAFLCPTLAASQPVCGPRDKFLEHLRGKYDEQPVGLGVTGGGGVLEMLAAPDGKTWTIIVTTPGGLSCVAAAGHAWEPLDGEPVSEDGT